MYRAGIPVDDWFYASESPPKFSMVDGAEEYDMIMQAEELMQ
jgi:hypothetical protein